MKLDDFEEELGPFLRFLNGEQTNPRALLDEHKFQMQADWRQLEVWADEHLDPGIRALRKRAFDLHDQEAMNQLRLEYDWMLKREE